MEPNACHEHLAKLLTEEVNALAQLEDLLDREHQLLLDNNIDELDRAGELRQACVTTLVGIEEERTNLCRLLNVPADMHGLERLLTWCDPSKDLRQRWTECAERATRCRNSNERNGALVSARLKRVEGLLDTLTGRSSQPKTYGRQGGYDASGRSGHVLATV